MEPQDNSEKIGINVNIHRLVSYVLVASMLSCVVFTLSILVNHNIPEWRLSYLIVLCFVVALERLYTYRLFRGGAFFSKERLVSFGAQAIVILALTKATVGLSHGWNAFVAEIPRWSQSLEVFLDLETFFALVVVVAVWWLSGAFASQLDEIGQEQPQVASAGPMRYDLGKNVPARNHLIGLFFSLGVILVILTILNRLDLRVALFSFTAPAAQISALAVGGASTLLYFILGLALLSQTQLISLHVRWTAQKIPVNGSLAKQWTGYSLLFLGLVALLVSLLPANINIQVTSTITRQTSLMPTATPTQVAHLTPLPKTIEGGKILVEKNSGGWEIVKTFLFWAVFVSVLFFAAWEYLRQRQGVVENLRKLPRWNFLAQLWDWLRRLFARAQSGVASLVAAGRERAFQMATRPDSRGGFINPRKLDPRRRIYFFYLALVRRGGEKGIPRSLSQTPDEYAAALQAALPAADEDIRALTRAFVDARYSRQPVQPEQAQSVENAWERIRKALRGKLGKR